ncbi:hypothetical protein WA026_007115 [Henosepilachna vigintioctopunctata]|uniref:Uncharacterized protein n=1 Tax=Henosepilachna vigintioctopunctata TaxID=420089 RepID=A0AAW1V3S0_9CUCU
MNNYREYSVFKYIPKLKISIPPLIFETCEIPGMESEVGFSKVDETKLFAGGRTVDSAESVCCICELGGNMNVPSTSTQIQEKLTEVTRGLITFRTTAIH